MYIRPLIVILQDYPRNHLNIVLLCKYFGITTEERKIAERHIGNSEGH